jgi:cytochrome c peroxidase
VSDDAPEVVWAAVMKRLTSIEGYVARFGAAFPGTPVSDLRFAHAARAIAAFERAELTRASSRFDRYLARVDGALTVSEKQGAMLFFTTAGCAQCHNGPLLGGQSFANTGVPQIGPGRGSAAPLDVGADWFFAGPNAQPQFVFRVAPLRSVALTAPYMHDGAYPTLEAVVRHYNDVPKALATYDVTQVAPAFRASYHGDAATIKALLSSLDARLQQPLGLSEDELKTLVAFLQSLTDPSARDMSSVIPSSVPSGLPVPD